MKTHAPTHAEALANLTAGLQTDIAARIAATRAEATQIADQVASLQPQLAAAAAWQRHDDHRRLSAEATSAVSRHGELKRELADLEAELGAVHRHPQVLAAQAVEMSRIEAERVAAVEAARSALPGLLTPELLACCQTLLDDARHRLAAPSINRRVDTPFAAAVILELAGGFQ